MKLGTITLFALAVAGIAGDSTPKQVRYFDAATVQTAFDKGSVLFDAGERYMVHASRREKPGMAEIHNDDADIVYVLDGTAALVTGGRAIDAKQTGPGELRGTSIEGGETRGLRKGDVVIIPAGTPHWFQQVSAPFLYYVVKVR
jgi:glc operon protein GlcG